MSDDSNTISDLKAAFARLEGSITTEMKHLGHDVKNITTMLGAYATTKDVNAVTQALDSRLSKVEGSLTWAVRLVVGFVLTAVMALLYKGGRP